MNAPFNIPALLASMEALLAAHPELADDETLRSDMLEGCTNAVEALSVLANWQAETEANIDVLKAREDLLKTRRHRMEKRAEVIRASMQKVLETAGLKKVELPEATISLRPGPAKVVIVDEHDLPSEFVRIRREPDKRALAEALKSGKAVLGAVLANGEPTISVRRT